jgi:hypothetical protein
MTRTSTTQGRLYTPVDMCTAQATARRYRAKAYRDFASAITRGLIGGAR